jgi:nicotinamide-nucleotide amidase
VLTGRIADRNGPWLSERLAELGVEVAHILVVGDRIGDLEAALRFMTEEGMDLIVTSGGLGPTADDLTAEVVGHFAGREMVLDEEMEEKIAAILRGFARRAGVLKFDPEALREANRKQAIVPAGSTPLDPVGTAPGLVVPAGERVVVVLPGPPRELQPMWPAALATAPVSEVIARATPLHGYTLRMFGVPESEIAKSLREIEEEGVALPEVEITTCLRRGEIEIDVRYRDAGAATAAAVKQGLAERHPRHLFSLDGETIDSQVASLLAGHRLGLAESCSGGLLAARITDLPGASAYMAGGVVSYSNEAKAELLGVDPGLIEEKGAVSPEVAEQMALGALERFDADVAVAITGIAGPDGGTEEKPVGYVCFDARLADGTALARAPVIPGGRADIRERSALVGMHMLRLLLSGKGTFPQERRHDFGTGECCAVRRRPVAWPAMTGERLKSPRARLFVALDLPESLRAGILAWGRRELRDPALRVVRPESLHVTLAFLGWLPEKAIGQLGEIVAGLRHGAPTVELGDPVAKPSLRRARLFALPAASSGGISLQAELESALIAERLYEPEKRAFWPHVTVARVKPGGRGQRRPASVEKPPGELPRELLSPVRCVRVTLYRSELKPSGAEYRSLAQVELPHGGRQ